MRLFIILHLFMPKKIKNDPDLQYYYCCMGPFSRKKLDKMFPNGEGIIRGYLQHGFMSAIGVYPRNCASGWGVSEEQSQAISFATYNDELKKCVINSYKEEGKELPRWAKAWDLLFKEESENKK